MLLVDCPFGWNNTLSRNLFAFSYFSLSMACFVFHLICIEKLFASQKQTHRNTYTNKKKKKKVWFLLSLVLVKLSFMRHMFHS
jgi:hypothetical protein